MKPERSRLHQEVELLHAITNRLREGHGWTQPYHLVAAEVFASGDVEVCARIVYLDRVLVCQVRVARYYVDRELPQLELAARHLAFLLNRHFEEMTRPAAGQR